MGIIEEINGLVSGFNRNESLASLLKKEMERQLTEPSAPITYHYVTHLTNPPQRFYSHFNPKIKKPPELARKLARGKQLQNFASVWLRTLPDFIVEEGTLDGVWVGLPGVRGKIDYRVADSILEFKTKDNLPETPEEITSSYPQDLDQLVFYSIMHPSKPEVNYLVFMKNSTPFDLKAFKVIIKDANRIKTILHSRIKTLDKSFETKDPSELGRCRYYKSGCQFEVTETCKCDEIDPIKTDAIQQSVEITFDADFTKKLEDVRDTYGTEETSSFTSRDIIAPRKHYMEEICGLESPYRSDITDEYKACLWASVSLLKRNLKIDLSKPERQSVVESQLEPRARIGFRWLKLKTSAHSQDEISPYLLKVSLRTNRAATKSPASYYIAELGIVCATYGKSKGLIFVVYPNLDKLVRVFQVGYENTKQIRRKVGEIIDAIIEAEQDESLLSIPPCPRFMNDKGKCPLMKECHSEKKSGCTS